MNGRHFGYQETSETHAQRIASIINSVKTGVFVHPLTITYDDEMKELEIDDGWHRMRAFYFLNLSSGRCGWCKRCGIRCYIRRSRIFQFCCIGGTTRVYPRIPRFDGIKF